MPKKLKIENNDAKTNQNEQKVPKNFKFPENSSKIHKEAKKIKMSAKNFQKIER